MNEEISIEHDGRVVVGSYLVIGDTLHVYFPDGNSNITELRGLKPEVTAKMQLKAHVKNTIQGNYK